jgi:5'-methylthioadenosine phosphorylase
LTAHHDATHIDFSQPFDARLTKCLSESGDVVAGGVYGGGDGPRYETPAEIRMLKTLGVDVVGMTASSEAIAMRENGISYACLAIVTNLAAGISANPLSHEEVVAEMSLSGRRALDALMAGSRRFLSL